MNKTTLNSQKEKHSMLSLRRATSNSKVLVAVIELFLSTLSLRRATEHGTWVASGSSFLSTLSLRRATNQSRTSGLKFLFLSTLSLRRATGNDIPRGTYHRTFLSTLSLRRATLEWTACAAGKGDFYPRSPCGERRRALGF